MQLIFYFIQLYCPFELIIRIYSSQHALCQTALGLHWVFIFYEKKSAAVETSRQSWFVLCCVLF